MSGEAGGLLIGGLLLIGALPYILAGAAVIGGAIGLGALAKAGISAGIRRHRESQLKVNNCSAELQSLYGQLRTSMERQTAQSEAYYAQMERQLSQSAQSIRSAVRAESGKSAQDMRKMDEMLRRANEETSAAMGAARVQELERIRKESREETTRTMAAIEKAQQTKMAAVDWAERTAAAEARQKAMAQDLLRDAAASVRLLETLAGSSGGEAFRSRVETIRHSYTTATEAFEKGQYQASAATAQTIVTRSAVLALEHEQELVDKDEIRVALAARLEGLKAEMESQSTVSFIDDEFGPIEEYMDDFTQEEFSRLQQEITAMLDEVQSEESDHYSVERLEQMLEQVENVLTPDVALVISTGHQKLLRYYERLHALQIITDHMKEQGFTMDWAQPVGDDVTQKLVVHFSEPVTGNTISVALDEDVSAGDAGRMAMDVMFYYANGRPVTEEEKESVRQSMLGALRARGMQGALSCKHGTEDAEASDKTLDNVQAVRELPAQPIFARE